MGQPVGGRGDEGVEVNRASSATAAASRPSTAASGRVARRPRGAPVDPPGGRRRRRWTGGRDLVQDLEPDLDGLAGERGQRALDEGHEPALHPVPDRGVRHPQDEHPLVPYRWPRPVRLPKATFATWPPRPVHATTPCNVSTARCSVPPAPPHRLPGQTVHNVVHRCGTQVATWSFERTPLRRRRLVGLGRSRLASRTEPPWSSAAGTPDRPAPPRAAAWPPRRTRKAVRREANLPTKHPQAGQDPWLPPAHVDPRRAGRSCGPTAQGAPASDRLRVAVGLAYRAHPPAGTPSNPCADRLGAAAVAPSGSRSWPPSPGRDVSPGGIRNWASLRFRRPAQPPPPPSPRGGDRGVARSWRRAPTSWSPTQQVEALAFPELVVDGARGHELWPPIGPGAGRDRHRVADSFLGRPTSR